MKISPKIIRKTSRVDIYLTEQRFEVIINHFIRVFVL